MPEKKTAADPFVAGCIAASVAGMLMHPVQLVHVRLQLMDSRSKRPGALFHLLKMLEKSDMRTVYTGFSNVIGRQGIKVIL